ncbi:MAG: hypothetical protein RBU37_10465 [Myxococcota bacterium]|nr:hypothetical protein [Myxococcota bacterium]
MKQYFASDWVPLGVGPIDTSAPADQVSLAFVDGVPMVAYVVGTGTHGTLYVRRFEGGAWVPHGQALSPTASKPSLANVNGVAHVAFYDHAANSVRLVHFPHFP